MMMQSLGAATGAMLRSSMMIRRFSSIGSRFTCPLIYSNGNNFNSGSAAVMSTSIRNYASVKKTHKESGVTSELVSALAKEIDEEKKLANENYPTKGQASAIPGFVVETDGALIRLTKTFDNEKIVVKFNVNHSIESADDHMGYEEEEDTPQSHEHEDSSSANVSMPPFTIDITKGDQCLRFEMQMVKDDENYDYQVEEFFIMPADMAHADEVDERIYSSSGAYIDDQLHELLFVRYLEERGFDRQFCNELVNLSTRHEHEQYVVLLNSMKAFITK